MSIDNQFGKVGLQHIKILTGILLCCRPTFPNWLSIDRSFPSKRIKEMSLFSAWFLGESLPGVSGYVGVGLITAAAATNAFLETKEGTIDSEEAKETANLK